MQGFHENCIFCFEKLPPFNQRKGKGEHIVPEFLMGSVCIKDVCTSCNSAMGSEVDHKALEDYRIIGAIDNLNLPSLKKKLLDRGKAKTKDVHTGAEVPTKTKGGKPKIIRHLSEGGILNFDESEAFEEARKRFKRKNLPHLPPAKVDEIIDTKLKPLYQEIEVGGIIHAPEFGLSFRKGRVRTQWNYKVTPYASRRLIAKIAYECAFIFLPGDRLRAFWDTLDKLRTLARYGEPNEEYLVLYPPGWREEEYDPKKATYDHTITFMYWDECIAIDISLFGIAEFRITLFSKDKSGTGALKEDEREIRGGRLAMTFEPSQPLGKYLGYLLEGQEKGEMFDAKGLL